MKYTLFVRFTCSNWTVIFVLIKRILKQKPIEMGKINCWEFKKCGREPGGANVKELGICPATTERRANGIHGGKNGGRCCWAILATACSGGNVKEKSFSEKLKACTQCEFYKATFMEERRLVSTYKTPLQIAEMLANTPNFIK